MNHRHQYINTLLYKATDKIPLMPGSPREDTFTVWRKQGYPDGDTSYYEVLFNELGISLDNIPMDTVLPVSTKHIPIFEEKILEHKNGHYICQDRLGAIVEISDEYDLSYLVKGKGFVTRKWHSFPVKTREDFENIKYRVNADTPGRFEGDLGRFIELQKQGHLIHLRFTGPFWQLRNWLGFETLCIKFIEDPELIQDMIDFWTDFITMIIKRVVKETRIDSILISEDMAYKAHSMISPKMIRKFIAPSWEKWIKVAKEGGCQIFNVDSDGYIEEIIPILIESGFNCCCPMEVAAGNDIIHFRKIFGKNMAYTGGLDKRELAKGGSNLYNEVMRIAPIIKEGGFIPGCDHAVPTDISWQNYVEYSRLLAKLSGWL